MQRTGSGCKTPMISGKPDSIALIFTLRLLNPVLLKAYVLA